MSILDDVAQMVADAMGESLCRAATLHAQPPRTPDGRGGYTAGAILKLTCRALVTEYSDYQRLAGNIPANVRKVLILAATIDSGVRPKPGDTLVLDGEAWGLHEIAADPAGATFECRATRVPVPAGDTTPTTNETLLSDVSALLYDAMASTLFKSSTLYKPNKRATDGRGGYVATWQGYDCSALITEYTDFQRGVDNIPAKDRKALILAGSTTQIPAPGDVLAIDGSAWSLVTIDSDPARASYEGQATPAQIPTVGILGRLIGIVGNVTLSAAGWQRIAGDLSATLGNVVGTGRGGVGTPSEGAGSSTLDDVGIVATGWQRIAGTLSATLQDVEGVGTGRIAVVGSVSSTLGNVTLSATATNPGRNEVDQLLQNFTLVATGYQRNAGQLAATLQDVVGAGSAQLRINGALSIMLGDLTLLATGGSNSMGSAAITLANVTAAGAGYQRNAGALAVTLGDVAATGAGYQRNAGALSATLANVTSTAAGTPKINGAVSATLGDVAATGAGYQRNAGALSATLANVTSTAAGTSKINGAAAITLEGIYSTADGTSRINGALAGVIGDVAIVAAGYQRNAGALSATLGNVTATATGTPKINGAVAATLGDVTATAAGYQRNAGSLSSTLADVTAIATGTVPISGAASVTLGDVIATAAGYQRNAGSTTATLADLTVSGAGTIGSSLTTPVLETFSTNTDAKPTGTATGDFLLGIASIEWNAAGVLATPSGWTKLGSVNLSASSGWQLHAFWKYATGSEPSDYGFIPSDAADITILRFSGVDPSSPINKWSFNISDAYALNTRSHPGLTTTNDKTKIVFVTHGNASNNFDEVGGITLVTRWGAFDLYSTIYQKTQTTAGATGTMSHTQENTDPWVTLAIALNPSGVPAAPVPLASPIFVASGALATATAQTSRVPAAPAGQTTNDVEIAVCASENNADHTWSGTGWTKGGQTNSGTGFTVSWGWRRYNGTNVDPTISWTGAADAHARRYLYRGCKTSGTPVVTIGTPGTGTAATHTSTGGNTTADNSTVIYLDNAIANTALATPAGWVENVDSGSATGPCRTAAGLKVMSSSGVASGNISVTGAAAAWVQTQLELLAN